MGLEGWNERGGEEEGEMQNEDGWSVEGKEKRKKLRKDKRRRPCYRHFYLSPSLS
jgi:hypothetical protein